MSEERLRDLLERAVPEAPELDTSAIPARAAAERRKRLAAGGAAVAVAAVVTVVVGVGLSGDSESGDVRPADEIPTTPTGTTAPYDVPVCPERLPDEEVANTSVPRLDDLVAVRLCPDLTFGSNSTTPRRADLHLLADADALVHDVDRFRQDLAALPKWDTDGCGDDYDREAVTLINSRRSLMLIDQDGATSLVWTPDCAPVEIGGRHVEGSLLAQAFRDALDRQRDELDYTRPFDGDLTCGTPESKTVARPGREHLVAAVVCTEADKLVAALDHDQLAVLRAAWDDPQPITGDATPEDDDDCRELSSALSYVEVTHFMVATDHSDVVRLSRSADICSYLVWAPTASGQSPVVLTPIAGLGLSVKDLRGQRAFIQ